MRASCSSFIPPLQIFTSWPVASVACLQQLWGQIRWWERKEKHSCTPLKACSVETATGWSGICCTDFFELLTFWWNLETTCNNVLPLFAERASTEWCKTEKGGVFVDESPLKSVFCRESLLTHLILPFVDLSRLVLGLTVGWFGLHL